MRTMGLRAAVETMLFVVALSLAGCQPAQQPAADVKPGAEAMDEARQVAETVLGKQSEILARGDLARDAREQLLVVNRFSKGAADARGSVSSPVFVMRAAILEKDGGKWSEILRCDEHLKNPNGYLGGSSAARVSGWRLEYSRDAAEGLKMKFMPAESADAGGQQSAAFDVRWNKNTKRYQSFDQSHERYLNEIPVLETPQSTLR